VTTPTDNRSEHLNAPHLTEFAGRLDDLLDEGGLVIERVRRIA
jgi:hypothetical protein